MSRRILSAAIAAVGLSLLCAAGAHAANPFARILRVSNEQPAHQPQPVSAGGAYVDGTVGGGYGFASLDAPLYPSPRQDIPREVGYTVITNPALYPHEMLYPHKYRALYPPYYYKKCRIPFLPAPPLRGTEVTVKYRSQISPFTLFYAPKRQCD